MTHPTKEQRFGPMRKAFEIWVKRGWHRSFSKGLRRNEHGVYDNFDLQQAWFAFQAGWRRARR